MRIGTRVMTPKGEGELAGWLIADDQIVGVIVKHDKLGDPETPIFFDAYEPGQVWPLDNSTLEVAHVSKNHSHR